MIIADPMPVFPKCPGLGFTGQPDYLVQIRPRDGGWERRDRKWSRPLHRYTGVPITDRVIGDIQDVLEFWHAVGGRSYPFRFCDRADFKSCKTHQDYSALDQPFVPITGESYQLVKVYHAGALSQVREITRPIGSTILIANELGAVQDPDSYELDERTGILTITPTEFEGEPTSWGGLFDVKCRFDSDLAVTVSEPDLHNLTIAVKELREEPLE